MLKRPTEREGRRNNDGLLYGDTMSGIERPACERVRLALSAIIASETFARSERLRSFLAYIVEMDLSGKASHLKGYSIGVDVFGRPPGFDAGSDPLVRVQAGKLRKLLEQYYNTEGAPDPIRIRVPLGSYVPEYSFVGMGASVKAIRDIEAHRPRSVPDTPSRSWLPAPVSSHLALFSLLPLFFLAPSVYEGATNAAIGKAQFALSAQNRFPSQTLALPRLRILRCWPAGSECHVLADAIEKAAGYHRTVRVAGSRENDPVALSYAIRIETQPDGNGVYIRLFHESSGVAVDTRHFSRDQLGSAEAVAYEAVNFTARALSVNGPLYRHAARTGIASSLMECLIHRTSRLSSSASLRAKSTACSTTPPSTLAEIAPPNDLPSSQ